eukprot:CAMPEP_0195080078 /NCGR_PEP_ID=MMETSP0448-20130528/21872_1 /TAXON_ID=66468 /ORGANISM="Heterocapsa triquestra, Strain CCMP 448" /LENGTH=110 /DNA_ID=CAMNT_0040112989 /DNA_START=108 /DNA_END=440 /DNA_ORIENTATION=+
MQPAKHACLRAHSGQREACKRTEDRIAPTALSVYKRRPIEHVARWPIGHDHGRGRRTDRAAGATAARQVQQLEGLHLHGDCLGVALQHFVNEGLIRVWEVWVPAALRPIE